MKIGCRISVPGVLLGFTHLTFALWVYSQHYEGGWGYFPIAVIDFPVTLILAGISRIFELPSWWPWYFVVGSVWWYFVGMWLTRFFSKHIENKGRK